MNTTIVDKFLGTLTPDKQKKLLRWLGGQDEKTWQTTVETQALLMEMCQEKYENEYGKSHHAEFLYGTLLMSIRPLKSIRETTLQCQEEFKDIFGGEEKTLVSIWLKADRREPYDQDQQEEFDYAMLVLALPRFWWVELERELSTLTYEEHDRIGECRRQSRGLR